MAIIQAQGRGLEPLIEVLLNEKKLSQEKQRISLLKKEQDLKTAERQNILQSLAQQFVGGGQFAQQFVGSTPSLAGALQDRQLSEAELRDPRVLAAASGVAEARQTFDQRRATEDALSRIGRIAAERRDPSLIENARIAMSLQAAGAPQELVRDLLPPDARDIVDLQAARVRLRGEQDARSADTFATSWLQRQGIVPEGAPLIPGASKTLLTVAEARAGDEIDWMKEGIDFITGRVGDSVSGSPFAVGPDGTLTFASGTDAVDVTQAIGEWRQIVETYAPPEARDRILKQLDSGLFERRLNRDRAVLMASDIIRNAGDNAQAIADVREILAEDFTASEVTDILTRARQRAGAPRR